MIRFKPFLFFEYSGRLFEELAGVFMLLSTALLLGSFTDHWILAFLLAFGVYLVRNLFYFLRFLELARGQELEPERLPFGVWGDVYESYFEKSYQEKGRLKRLRTETQQIQQAMNLLPDAHISLTRKFRIEWVNHSAEQLLGLRQSDVGQKITNLLRQPELLRYLRTGLFDSSVEFYASAESSRRLSVQLVAYFDKHFLLIIRDITDAHNLAQVRRDFVANASHELRTPLTVLNGYLELMLDQPETLPKIWRTPIQQMHGQALRMQKIISDLLTLSTIENDSQQGAMEQVDIVSQLHRLEQDANQLSDGKHQISFSIETNQGLIGQTEFLRSVFTNLVANAIRYTPADGKISVRWFKEQHALVFEVRDTGIGIDREHIPRLTERFYQVDAARASSTIGTHGTGLGLAIVKHILERHKAKLVITSRLQVGSTFRCEFPLSFAKSP